MRSLARILVLLLGGFVALAQNQNNVFRMNVQLVRLLVTVKDAAGGLVGSLNKQDFTVLDDGAPQTISVFERRTEQPLSVAVMVDTSGSTAKDLRYELDSVSRFLHALLREGNPEDAAALYSFNWQVTLQTAFTRRIDKLEERLRRLHSEGGTSLYDALFLASRSTEGREGRHVLIVVTDGGDTTSDIDFNGALEAAQLAETIIYPILVIPITNDAGRNTGGEHALATIAQRTGGRVFAPSLGPSLDAAFDEILRELRTQYYLGFYPQNIPATKNRFHTITVKTSRPDFRVFTRSGYYGEASGQ